MSRESGHTDVVRELAQAYRALPESVAGDAAPDGATLADRIRAMDSQARGWLNGFGHCHRRHLDVEDALRELLALATSVPIASRTGAFAAAIVRARSTLERHHATSGAHIPADHPSRQLSVRGPEVGDQHVDPVPLAEVTAYASLVDMIGERAAADLLRQLAARTREMLDQAGVDIVTADLVAVNVSGRVQL